MKNLGPLDELMGMLPGMNTKALKGLSVDDREIVKVQAIIQSMTLEERENPNIVDSRRRKRIANGSGTTVQDVNKLLKQFKETQKMMKRFTDNGKDYEEKKGKFGLPFF